ncbi:MAG: InlB B-repeat-containing protein [Eubacteriaceae bacterium]|jgi:uncharacterized repeat protein (TIGR02543 family)|nr:InlB B-repeat-containing protein [Eubacteriaceae bacterium]
MNSIGKRYRYFVLAFILSAAMVIAFGAAYCGTSVFAAASALTEPELIQAIASAASGDTITLGADITADQAIIVPAGKKITIDGAGHVIKRDASLKTAAIDVAEGADVTLKNITADGNAENVTSSVSLITVEGTLTLDKGSTVQNNKLQAVNARGGGIFVDGGTINISGGVVQGNSCYGTSDYYDDYAEGGGIFLNAGASGTMTSGTIASNEAKAKGGGIGISNSHFAFSGGLITSNNVEQTGGGIFAYNTQKDLGSIDMSGGEITANTAGFGGGGVSAEMYTAFTMTAGRIIGNSGDSSAAVNVNSDAVMNMSGGEIAQNTCTGSSGTVSVSAGAVLNMTGGTIHDNSADGSYGGGIVVYGNADNPGYAVLSGKAKVYNNRADLGGGIMVWGEENAVMDIEDGAEIYGNIGKYGGGINVNLSGTVNMHGGKVYNNTAKYGGGVMVGNNTGTFNMTGGSVEDNTASALGGGLLISSTYPGTINLLGGTVKGNTAGSEMTDAVYQAGTLRINGAKAVVSGHIFLTENHYVGLVGKTDSRSYSLATADDDQADGRIVVEPDTVTYEGTKYEVQDAEPFVSFFSHAVKGVVKGSVDQTSQNDTGDLVLRGYALSFDMNKPAGVTADTVPAGMGTLNFTAGTKIGEVAGFPKDPTLAGYTFTGWTYDKEGKQAVKTDDVVSGNTVIYAQWKKNAEPQTPAAAVYEIKTSAAGGTITESCTVTAGSSKTIKYSAAEGYKISAVIVDGQQIDIEKYPSEYTFTNINKNHTISVTYSKEAASEPPFIMLKTIDRGTTMNLSWIKTAGATKYVIYGNYCNNRTHVYHYRKIAVVNSGSVTSYQIKHVLKGKVYKYKVVAFSGSRKLCTSNTTHTACGVHNGYHNAVKVKASTGAITVAAGKTVKISGSVYTSGGRLLYKTHCAKVRYRSRNSGIAKAAADGTIKGISAGKVKVYVYSPNGIRKAVVVTVK